VIQHTPLPVFAISSLLMGLAVWGFLEALVWTAAFLWSERRSVWFAGFCGKAEQAFGLLARRRRLAIGSVFLVVFLGRLAVLPAFGVPAPKFWDDFSQLLSGDTLAHWRVTNPTHPMWFYFETIFVNQKPTYNSMYPPGTGLFLAAGQIVTGQPWYGMLLSAALAAAGICWMLQGWMAPRWALWGALVFILLSARRGMTDNYWGEGIVVLGGALVVGAIPRILKRQSLASAFWLGTGISLLALTRPYEGAVFVAVVGVGGTWRARTRGWRTRALLKRVAVPVVAILIPVLLWMAYLNWRSTGNPLLAPYQLNLETQHMSEPFWWQKPLHPHYDYSAMASFYQAWEMKWWNRTHDGPRGALLFVLDKAGTTYFAIIWPLGVFLIIGCYQLFKNKERRFLPLALILFFVGLGLETYQMAPRYAESAWGLVILLAIYGIRYTSVWRRKSHQGLRLSKAAAVLIPAALVASNVVLISYVRPHGGEPWYWARWQALQALQALPGKQLVIVRYAPTHLPEEWVYNRADIDAAKVVWAREAPQGERPLLRYFRDRTAWLLEPDGASANLTLYSEKNADDSATQVGPFRVSCSDPVCEELKQRLKVAR
jgi:hypothetical protein